MGSHKEIENEYPDDNGGLKELKITKRTQQQHSEEEISANTVSLTFTSPFGKHKANSRNSSRQPSRNTSRPTSKRSSKRISGFDMLEDISMSGMIQPAPLPKSSKNNSISSENELENPELKDPHQQLNNINIFETSEVDISNQETDKDEHATSNDTDQAANEDQINENKNNNDETSSNESFGWEDMDAVATNSVYDENGDLQIYDVEQKKKKDQRSLKNIQFASKMQERKPSIDDEKNEDNINIDEDNSNMFAYTKINGEEQAKASRKTNVKIDNLIASATLYQRSSNANKGDEKHKNSTTDNTKSTSSNHTEGINNENEIDNNINEEKEQTVVSDDDDDDEITHDDLTKDNQLNGMKQLLTDNEKFAYAGCVFLLLNQLCADLATRNLNSNMIKDPKLAKRLHNIQKNYGYWKEEIMTKIYYHMEFNEDEIRMIENLGLFPLEINDLMKALKIQRKVLNPYNEELFNKDDNEHKESEELKISSMRSFDDSELTEKAPENIVSVDEIRHERELEVDVPWSVICHLFLLFLSKGNYDARSRVMLKQFAEYLTITNEEINQFEKRITETLELEQSEQQKLSRDDILKDRRKLRKRKKMAYVGLATVGGSLVLGLSGGLLAPVIGAGVAAGLSTVGITGLSGFLTGIGGTATVAATSTAIGANIGGSSMSRRMGSVKTFEFRPLYNNRRLNLIISISGWMTGAEDDVRLPFSTLDPVEGDLYSLYWEPDILKSTGDTMNILASEAITQTIQQVLGATILTALMGAIQVPMALSKLGYLIDNPWNVSLDRAWNSGLILAQYLIEKDLGDRPITLIGFSLGSRVIYYCLRELCKRGATGIVENVVLLGAPVVYNKDELVMCRSVVAGRFVNGYSEKDWILGYLFRATAGGISTVAGLTAIESEGIENFDCSDLVNGHMGYRKNIPKILKQLGFETLSDEFVEIDDKPDPDREKKQKELLDTLKKLDKDEKKKKKSSSWLPKWMKPKKEEWQEMVKQDVVAEDAKKKDQNELEEVAEYVPESKVDTTSDSNKLNKDVSGLKQDDDECSSPVFQEGETFSLKLNKSRPRFVSGNVGFALKNAGKSRTSSEIIKNSSFENIKQETESTEIKQPEEKEEVVAAPVENAGIEERQSSVIITGVESSKSHASKESVEDNIEENPKNEINEEQIETQEKEEKETDVVLENEAKEEDKKEEELEIKDNKKEEEKEEKKKEELGDKEVEEKVEEEKEEFLQQEYTNTEVEESQQAEPEYDSEYEREEDDVSSIEPQSLKKFDSQNKEDSLELHELRPPNNPATNPRFSRDSSFFTANDEQSEKLIDEELSKKASHNDGEDKKPSNNEENINNSANMDETMTQDSVDDINGVSQIDNFIENELNIPTLSSSENVNENKNYNINNNDEDEFDFVQPLKITEGNSGDADDEQKSLQSTTSAENTESDIGRPSLESTISTGSKRPSKKTKKKRGNRKRK
ncbi:DUF726-domain-containing protein [Hanseniaspora valbyensis NRRL Y-1626]|uniref:DUF726-domain-containing protein n=1 Tax=Hanseniaspora valbyensis NRRL Y-1626 TaxID=766949 RepID=A0A1B7TA53_9ASCO|nr:DUF726-domain-containing protein [Hanseniaspora valbyensis NRRL Y-1626]